MSDLLVFQGIKATTCDAYGTHRPHPGRFVWHHIQPQVCGGPTQADNLVQCCDNCHFIIHIIMWLMVFDPTTVTARRFSKTHLRYAKLGYDRAKAAGLELKMPKEAAA